MKAFVSWSGGKESALACRRAQQMAGMDVTHLLTMLTENGATSRSHELTVPLLQRQAEHMGASLTHSDTSWDNYEGTFKQAVTMLKDQGIEAGVFGDIDVQAHRDWVERVCAETGIRAILPLWQSSREELMEEFISSGFRALVVVVNNLYLQNDWLGRTIDETFRHDIRTRAPHVDLCGEKGEYHTFVYDGPIFRKPVPFVIGDIRRNDGYGFLRLASP